MQYIADTFYLKEKAIIYDSFLKNNLIIARPKDEPLFIYNAYDDHSIKTRLDGYTIIPNELFISIGGNEHPIFKEWYKKSFAGKREGILFIVRPI